LRFYFLELAPPRRIALVAAVTTFSFHVCRLIFFPPAASPRGTYVGALLDALNRLFGPLKMLDLESESSQRTSVATRFFSPYLLFRYLVFFTRGLVRP